MEGSIKKFFGVHDMASAESFFDGDSHVTEEAAALYVDALKLNRTDQLPSVLLNHVADCMRCKAEVMGLFSVLEDQKYDRSEAHPYFDRETNTRKWMRQAYRIAAVILLVIGVGVAIYFIGLKKPELNMQQPPQAVQPIEAGRDSTELNRKQGNPESGDGRDLYASRFVPSPNLEDLVDSRVRSAGFKAISPAVGEVVKGNVLFVWENRDRARITLRILNNKERVQLSSTIDSSRFLFTGKLPPGLYYWKLEANDELLYLGKFVVN